MSILLLLLLAFDASRDLAPCPTEDYAYTCIWDAQEQGNGEGHSFLVLPDGTVVPEGPAWA